MFALLLTRHLTVRCRYAIKGTDEEWDAAMASVTPGVVPTSISIKGKDAGDAKGKKRRRDDAEGGEGKKGKKARS